MKKIICFLIIIFTLSIHFTLSQNLIIRQSIGKRVYNIKPILFNNFIDLPNNIQNSISSYLEFNLNEQIKYIKFIDGQIFDIEKAAEENPDLINKNNNIIPNYDLNYSYTDSVNGIYQYWLNIGIDKYGQILYFNFPKEFKQRKLEIINPKKAKQFSDSIILTKDVPVDIENYQVELEYDKCKDILIWSFCYLIEKGIDYKNYSCLMISAHELRLIDEQGMVESWISPCCEHNNYGIKTYDNISLEEITN